MAIGATSDVGAKVVGAIREASRVTGTGFEYLLKTAMRESSFNPNAKSHKSSAAGLFQFIDQTWLATVKQSGPSLGYGRYAGAITHTSSGRYVVRNAAMRRQIMNLRFDPTANAMMAGAFTQRNAQRLAHSLGRAPTDGELYIAHFLGQSGAAKLIATAENAPQARAASLFPHAARANHSIFFNKHGGARTTAEVYSALVAKHDGTAMPRLPAVASAPLQPTPSASPPAPVTTAAPATAAAAPAPAPVATVAAPSIVGAPPATTAAYAPEPGPMFGNLFTSDRREAVSPFVRDLWGASSVGAAAPAPAATAQPAAAATGETVPAAASAGANGQIGAAPGPFRFLRPDAPAPAGGRPI
ncbi:MAG TPA: transglycosylase SLT domain-containing protein [Xanthobacteraceae bacterium]|nr:transglycosylase SLT domain-containing protein [Xanthobacteraceae bacterium]